MRPPRVTPYTGFVRFALPATIAEARIVQRRDTGASETHDIEFACDITG